jgi:hypothetical protein
LINWFIIGMIAGLIFFGFFKLILKIPVLAEIPAALFLFAAAILALALAYWILNVLVNIYDIIKNDKRMKALYYREVTRRRELGKKYETYLNSDAKQGMLDLDIAMENIAARIAAINSMIEYLTSSINDYQARINELNLVKANLETKLK